MQDIWKRYFDMPNRLKYDPSELQLLGIYIPDLINDIIPSKIPYRAVLVDSKWLLVDKDLAISEPSEPN